MSKTPRRRSTEQVRRLILDAAQELFEANGYEATTTKDIADRAGVFERLLFTNFGSKGALFDAAVVAPFAEAIEEYVDAWERRAADYSREDRVALLIEAVYDLTKRDRVLLVTAIARRLSEPRSEDDLLERLAKRLNRLLDIDDYASAYPDMDPPAALSVFAGTVIGTALLDDMVFPRGTRVPGRARVKKELAKTLLDGYRNRRRA